MIDLNQMHRWQMKSFGIPIANTSPQIAVVVGMDGLNSKRTD